MSMTIDNSSTCDVKAKWALNDPKSLQFKWPWDYVSRAQPYGIFCMESALWNCIRGKQFRVCHGYYQLSDFSNGYLMTATISASQNAMNPMLEKTTTALNPRRHSPFHRRRYSLHYGAYPIRLSWARKPAAKAATTPSASSRAMVGQGQKSGRSLLFLELRNIVLWHFW